MEKEALALNKVFPENQADVAKATNDHVKILPENKSNK